MTPTTHITVLLDRTGSMQDIRDDVIGGFNRFLDEQQRAADEATFTLVQFDSQDPYEVVQATVPIRQANPLTADTFVPRASTPLYDAMGRGINDLAAQLAALGDAAPAKVVFVVVTDGAENASHEFTRSMVMDMIVAKRKAGWQFVFLSADLEAFEEAGAMGVAVASRLHFMKSGHRTQDAFASVSDKISAYRERGADQVAFDEDDRRQQRPTP